MASIKDLKSGDRFGRLTAVRYVERRNSNAYWEFKCDCGNNHITMASLVLKEYTRSCGCLRRESAHNRENVTGQRFGRLVAIKYVKTVQKKAVWLFECDCGKKHQSRINSVKKGTTQSCGCLHSEVSRERGLLNRKHGRRGTKEYNAWRSLKQRCYGPKTVGYKHYGGRGIKVCDRWLESFENFFEDMGLAPSAFHSIDRIDNNGDYCLSNCRWTNILTQANNKTTSKKLLFLGKERSLGEWVRELNLPYSTICERLRHGWSVEKALSTPVRKKARSQTSK